MYCVLATCLCKEYSPYILCIMRMSKLLDEIEQDIAFFETTDKRNKKRLDDLSSFIDYLPQCVDDCSEKFERLTKLKKSDYPYICLCSGLQALRQYLVTDFKERLNDQEAAKKVKGNKKEFSARGKRNYYQSIEQIKYNPVPYDAFLGSKELGAGISGNNHRFKCPGHDPVLGFFFGTLNIMTGTITVWEGYGNSQGLPGLGLKNYFVKTDIMNVMRDGHETLQFRDFLKRDAGSVSDIVDAVYSRIRKDPSEGLTALFEAVKKEYIHLKSDKDTIQSLPVPGVSLLSADLSKSLSNAGFDLKNFETVGKQYVYSYLINQIVRFLYYLIHKSTEGYTDEHRVRLDKILTVSNVVSTSTNLMFCLIGSMFNEQCFKKLDVGGTLVTFRQLTQSADFINAMKKEYIDRSINQKIDMI